MYRARDLLASGATCTAAGAGSSSRLGEVTFEVARTLEELAPALEEAFRLHAARWRDRPEASGFATPAGRRFHRAALRALAPLGVARIALLRVGRPRRRLQLLLPPRRTGCTSTSWRSTRRSRAGRPGQVATLDAIEAAAAEGARRVEFLGGGERYKLELADRLEPLYQGLGLATTPRGRAAVAARAARSDARRRLKRTPARRLYYEGLAPARRDGAARQQRHVGAPRKERARPQPGAHAVGHGRRGPAAQQRDAGRDRGPVGAEPRDQHDVERDARP